MRSPAVAIVAAMLLASTAAAQQNRSDSGPDTAAAPYSDSLPAAASGDTTQYVREDSVVVDCAQLAERISADTTLVGEQSAGIGVWTMPSGPPPKDAVRTIHAHFVLGPDGLPDFSTLVIIGTKDATYRVQVEQALERMHFRAAQVSGCPVAQRIWVSFPYR